MDLKLPASMLFAGKTGGGKSFAMKYVIYKVRKQIDFVACFSGTSTLNGSYDFLPSESVYASPDNETMEIVLRGIMDRQKKLADKLKKKGQDIPEGLPRGLIIFDDVISVMNWGSKFFTDLITNHRHFRLSLMFATQSYCKIPVGVRNQCNYIFVFKNGSGRIFKAMYEDFGEQYFDKYVDWKNFLVRNTDDHKMIFIDVLSKNSEDAIIVTKAKHREFTFTN